ncbi:MAG: hypothetical protein QXQ46_04230 [Thermoplasmatales archaeon]
MLKLSSDKVELSVVPQLGGVILSIRYLPKSLELLAQFRQPDSGSAYKEGVLADNLLDLLFVGGYYEVLPNAGYKSEYSGVKFGLHDETPYLAWKAEFDEERDPDSILLIASLIKYPLKLFKRITLKGNLIILNEKLINESPTARLPFSWLHHPTFGEEFIDSSAELELPQGVPIIVDESLQSGATCLLDGYQGEWPMAMKKDGKSTDLSRFPEKGEENCDDLVYVPSVKEGKFRIINKKKGVLVEASWDKKIFGSLWLWRPLGGGNTYPWYGRVYATAVEIATSIPASGLAEQVRLGTAKWIDPNEIIETSLKYEIKEIDRI